MAKKRRKKRKTKRKKTTKLKYRRKRSFAFNAIFSLICLSICSACAFLVYITFPLPNFSKLNACFKTTMTKQKRCVGQESYVKLSDISKYIKQTVVTSEDQKFYRHSGIDYASIRHSIQSNLKEGKIVRGGSTISQQLIKNLYLNTEKSFSRKFRELIYTFELERRFTKNKILELYLNVAEFGPRVYGVKKAAQFYFQKSPSELSLFESLFMTHVLPSPYYYSENFLNGKLSDFNKKQMMRINDWMLRFNHITKEEHQLTKQEITNW